MAGAYDPISDLSMILASVMHDVDEAGRCIYNGSPWVGYDNYIQHARQVQRLLKQDGSVPLGELVRTGWQPPRPRKET